MQKLAIILAGFLTFSACSNQTNERNDFNEYRGSIHLEITIIADTTHSLQLHTYVKKGAPLQKIMQAVLPVGYADPAQKFVNSLIGVKANPAKKEFWFLKINGEASQVGISEIRIEDKTQVLWQLKNY